jgi:hypothetical protein
MDNKNIDIDIIDFIDLLDFTLSNEFIEKWRYKYSEKFLKHFQIRLLDTLSNQKPLKINNLYTYLTKKCSYSSVQVLNFFESIDINIYSPLIFGKLAKPLKS